MVHDMSGVGVDDAVRVVAEQLTGDILQVPPMVSALKVGGRRLHELARRASKSNADLARSRCVGFDVSEGSAPGVLHVDVECSSGTYIRSLAADLGRLLGGGAHLRDLRRVAVGSFTIDEAAPPGEVAARPSPSSPHEVAAVVANGLVLEAWPGDGPWAVFDQHDGVCSPCTRRIARTGAKPSVVLPITGCRVASQPCAVVTHLTKAASPWPTIRHHAIGAYDGVHLGHQAVIHRPPGRRRLLGPLGGAHVRPSPGHDRATGIGTRSCSPIPNSASNYSPTRASRPPSC